MLDAGKILIIDKGDYSNAVSYEVLDSVMGSDGIRYISKVNDNLNNPLSDINSWSVLANRGVGITKVEKVVPSVGLVDTYKITFEVGEPFEYSITNGKDGNTWYRCSGTAMEGKSTTDTKFENSGISFAKVGDFALNTTTGFVYHCTVEGNPTDARWVYDLTLLGSGSGGDVEWADVLNTPFKTVDFYDATENPLGNFKKVDNKLFLADNITEKLNKLLITGATKGQFLVYDGTKWIAGDGASDWDSVSDKPFNTIGDGLKVENNVLKADGASDWDSVSDKPFNTIGDGLKVENNVLKADIESAGTWAELTEKPFETLGSDFKVPTSGEDKSKLSLSSTITSKLASIATLSDEIKAITDDLDNISEKLDDVGELKNYLENYNINYSYGYISYDEDFIVSDYIPIDDYLYDYIMWINGPAGSPSAPKAVLAIYNSSKNIIDSWSYDSTNLAIYLTNTSAAYLRVAFRKDYELDYGIKTRFGGEYIYKPWSANANNINIIGNAFEKLLNNDNSIMLEVEKKADNYKSLGEYAASIKTYALPSDGTYLFFIQRDGSTSTSYSGIAMAVKNGGTVTVSKLSGLSSVSVTNSNDVITIKDSSTSTTYKYNVIVQKAI